MQASFLVLLLTVPSIAASPRVARWPGRLMRAEDGETLITNTTNWNEHGTVSLAEVYVVICDEKDPRVEIFQRRLESFRYKVVPVDCSDAFRESRATGNKFDAKFGARMARYRDAIARLPDDAEVLVLDSLDMLVFGGVEEVSRSFRSFGVPLVASCTVAEWPPPDKCPSISNIASPYAKIAPHRRNANLEASQCAHPCAGALMGFKSAFLSLYAASKFTDETDDQCWLHETLSTRLKAGIDWKLDYKSQLFLEYQSRPNSFNKLSGGRMHVLLAQGEADMQTTPPFVHLDSFHPTVKQIRAFYVTADRI